MVVLFIFLAILVVWFMHNESILELQRRVEQLEIDNAKLRTELYLKPIDAGSKING